MSTEPNQEEGRESKSGEGTVSISLSSSIFFLDHNCILNMQNLLEIKDMNHVAIVP